MRVVGYTRASDDQGADAEGSLEAQVAEIAAFCREHGLEPVGMFRDRGPTAGAEGDAGRPGLEGAFGTLDLGIAEGIVVARLDRLTRSVAELGAMLERRFGGAQPRHLFAIAEGIDTRRPAGRQLLRVLATVSHWEPPPPARAEAPAPGRPLPERLRTVPYGWELAGDRGGLVRNGREQQVLRWIYRWWNRGNSLRAIARALNQLQIPTKTGRAGWSHSAVATLLKRTMNDGPFRVSIAPTDESDRPAFDPLAPAEMADAH